MERGGLLFKDILKSTNAMASYNTLYDLSLKALPGIYYLAFKW